MRRRYRCSPVSLRKPERSFILLPSIVDRYSETYGPTDFEYCLLAALLGPNRSSLAIERVGWALRAVNCGCAAARLEQGSHPQSSRRKCERPRMGPFAFWRWSESSAEDALHYSFQFLRCHRIPMPSQKSLKTFSTAPDSDEAHAALATERFPSRRDARQEHARQ